jgi:hypothetical protein
MRFVIPLVLVFGCERAPQPQKPIVVKREPAVAPIPPPTIVEEDDDLEMRGPHPPPPSLPSTIGLPQPPTDEPAAYKTWFDALPRKTQRKINTVCRKRPTMYQYICGGIGHLHIPYPPYPRAHRHRASDPELYFASAEAWGRSLTAPQRRYIDRHCVGGENMESSDLCGDNTPLVVSFDGAPVQFSTGASFAFTPGAPVATDWPRAPWLVLDRDGDGAITSGAELFGDHTPGARSAFGALRALDANGDGVIDARDPAFARLQLWTDDGDQRTAPAELRPLAERVVAISLASQLAARCDARGNCEGDRATLLWSANGTLHTGAVIDVYLPVRNESVAVDAAVPWLAE